VVKPKLAPSPGTLPTDNGLFIGLLIGVILILGGLQFLPASPWDRSSSTSRCSRRSPAPDPSDILT
jgi:hypothetical protein